MQTRGKPTRAFLHSGGTRRTIEAETVAALLAQHELPDDATTIEALTRVLDDRLASVDCPPTTLRGNPEIREIAKMAGTLGQRLARSQAGHDLSLAMRRKFNEMGWPYDDQFLTRALLVLAKAEALLMEEYRPVRSYYFAIRAVRDVIAKAGGNVALHETSALVCFLGSIETGFPGLIFPSKTDTTARARFRYVENALKGN